MGLKIAGIAVMVVGLFLLGALTAMLQEQGPSFSLMPGPVGATVWRIDNRTGFVSVCGTALAGRALSQAEMQLAGRIRAAGNDKAALAALAPELDDVEGLERPRCSDWSGK